MQNPGRYALAMQMVEQATEKLRYARIAPLEPGMWVVIYAFTISIVAAVLFWAVDRFEPERRYGLTLKFLIVCTAAAAVARQVLPLAWRCSKPDFTA